MYRGRFTPKIVQCMLPHRPVAPGQASENWSKVLRPNRVNLQGYIPPIRANDFSTCEEVDAWRDGRSNGGLQGRQSLKSASP